MSQTAEVPHTANEPANIAQKYWLNFAYGGNPPPSKSWKGQWRSAPFATTSPKVPMIEQTGVVVGLRQDLATAQACASTTAAEVLALQTKLAEFETQRATQAHAGKLAQERLRAARWRWTLGGFLGGCLVTIGVIEAFMIHFLSP
jgi:hypothetical protein